MTGYTYSDGTKLGTKNSLSRHDNFKVIVDGLKDKMSFEKRLKVQFNVFFFVFVFLMKIRFLSPADAPVSMFS